MDSVASTRHDEPLLSSGSSGGGQASPMMPPPAERLRDLRTPIYTAVASSSNSIISPTTSHSRSASMASATRRGNRLSLSLPVQSPNYVRHTPSSSVSATSGSSVPSTPFDKTFPSPVDSNGFLSALATQERRVLELKEELHRAESELGRLKRQWGLHEATKKRNESRHVEQLRSIPTNAADLGNANANRDGQATAQQDRDEGVKKHAKTPSKSGRKVMTGQRHTRTLSLLDPSRYGPRQSLDQVSPSPANQSTNGKGNSPDDTSLSPTLPDLIKNPASINEHQVENRLSLHGPPQDVILRTGRQMAEDFKDGLKTFFDDLRQATVGDEATNSSTLTTPRVTKRQGSKSSLRSSGKRSPATSTVRSNTSRSRSRDAKRNDNSLLIDMGGSFWKDHGVDERAVQKGHQDPAKKSLHARNEGAQVLDEDGDAWDAWDTPTAKIPSPRWSSSTYVSEGSPPPETFNLAQDISKTKDSTLLKHDEIPWPALQKLSPSNLKRTASTLMHEWEKSLTPPNEVAEEHSEYFSPSASPLKDGTIH